MFVECGSLGEAIGAGEKSAVLVFSGQDPDWADGLARALVGRPALRQWCEEVLAAIAARLEAHPRMLPALAADGIDPADWLDHPTTTWTAGERAGSTLCLMGSTLAHLVAARALAEQGVHAGVPGVVAVCGHSSGMLSAWTVARHGAEVPAGAAADAMVTFALLAQEASRHFASVDTVALERLFDGEPRADGTPQTTPMMSVAGPTEARLAELIARYGTDRMGISLQNCWDRWVLSGPGDELAAWVGAVAEAEGPEVVNADFLPSSSGYHHRLLEAETQLMVDSVVAEGLCFDGPLLTPLVDARDGTRHTEGDLTRRLVESMAGNAVRWADTISELVAAGDVVVDVGPSTLTAALTRRVLRGSGATVVAAGSREGARSLTLAAEWPEPLVDYSHFRPTVSIGAPATADTAITDIAETADTAANGVAPGRAVHTRHTRRSGRSAIVLAGMTPSTVDASVVSAAANAGHVAELAGGGQVSATILAERLQELAEGLGAGHEVVVNALHLDPYLWGLHLGRDRLVQRARANGAPIQGVTVSAGVPERDDAVALLDELNDLGIWLNAFKPGTVRQVRQVLDIADHSGHDVWLHLEGGRAGGHHSWVDLEEVLFATYGEIRARDNVVLCVGGGIATPERAAEFIGGNWALRHGGYPMPVDAVLLGTVAMATRESAASPSVKAALRAADGTDAVVAAGEWAGGVTSGRSSLGADIHYLDNTASRVAALLEEVAGDAEAVAGRHDEIAGALAATAKPWFGDLAAMTYLEMAERFAGLCARGRFGRYEDGRWFDVTHRLRFLDLLRRCEARCVDADEGTFASVFTGPGDLDDPEKAIEQLRARYPRVATTELEPPDVAHFLDVCDRPGKPVPFVAVIDAEVRRRYLADSLWQSHSDLWDADEVLVVPGPAALAGIRVVDEPVADLLDRFDSRVGAILAELGADAEAGPVEGAPGTSAVEVLLALRSVRWGEAMVPSPLAALAAGRDWELATSADRVEAMVALGDEVVRVVGPRGPVGTVEVTLTWPALADVSGDGSFRFALEVGTDHGVAFAVVDRAAIAGAQRGVLTMLAAGAAGVAAAAGPAPLELVDTTVVPDAAMASLWPALFEALGHGGAGNGLLRLVHLTHRITIGDGTADAGTGPAAAGATATVAAAVVGEDHVAAGRRLHTRASRGAVCSEDTFLIRGDVVDRAGDAGADPAPGAAEAGAAEADGAEAEWVGTDRHHLGRIVRRAPRRPEAFAALSGDFNPIHRSDLMARLAGLPGRIVHGMWTSAAAQAFVVEHLLGGDPARLASWSVDFLDVVDPGAALTFTATRVAVRDGARRVEVQVDGPRGPVALAHGTVTAVRTAYVFPGQGIQARGMGLDGYDRSPAARSIWDRADRFTRDQLGFSILTVVRDNPEVLRVGAEVHRHPAGVLHLTQFTQVAMATLAAAQTEELRASGALVDDAVLAGHSVGEYNALAATGGVLPLEAVLGIVWARGTAMHHLVPRDATGASQYRLGVVRPHLAGLDADAAEALVDGVSADTGELCEIVNHNLRGRQYAVAGTVGALEELERRLGEGNAPGRAPFLLVPGIDVPFHSRALTPGVAEFRGHLDDALPPEIDPGRLVGRYVPNLHPVPFSLDRGYVEAVAAACGGRACGDLLADWATWSAQPRRLARELLVELLAWQFASPVRWIETTDVLLTPVAEGGLGVQRIIEIGVGAAPTITNLTRAAVAAEKVDGVAVLHIELDHDEVFDAVAAPAPVPAPALAEAMAVDGDVDAEPGGDQPDDGDLGADWDGDAPGPARPASAALPAPAPVPAVVPTTAAAPAAVDGADPAAPRPAVTAGGSTADLAPGLADVVAALLAHEVGVTFDQLGDDSVDQLVDGASSRRNQVLMDMGKEFGIGAIDGAHEVGRAELTGKLSGLLRNYRYPGPVLDAAVSAGVAAALGPLGAGPSAITDHVTGAWGLGEGWVHRCRLELALGTRDGASRRGGQLRTLGAAGRADELIDEALAAAAARAGVAVSRPVAESSAASVDSAELDALARRVDAAFEAGAAAAAAALGTGDDGATDADAAEQSRAALAADAERLRVLDLEHGAERAEAVAPVFDEAAVRYFASSTAWARADLDHLFHGAVRGALEAARVDALASRLAAFAGTDDRFDLTTGWYGQCARAAGRDDVAALFDRIAAGPGAEQAEWRRRLGGRVVLVSGASPGSIGESVAARLLAAGATVVMVTSSTGAARRRAVRELERTHAGPGAELHLVRANLASFTDIDRLLDWLGTPPITGDGQPGPHPGLPEVVLPFAASSVVGDVPDTGPRNEVELRVLLLGVERLVGRLAQRTGDTPGAAPLQVVLPMSPNQGTFGGDGGYGDAKAGLEVLEARRRSEHARWGRFCRITGAEIGWVRGTGLMAGNDALAPLVEQRLGIHTFSAPEMGDRIAELCAADAAAHAGHDGEPARVDLTGGLATMADPGALATLLRSELPGRAAAMAGPTPATGPSGATGPTDAGADATDAADPTDTGTRTVARDGADRGGADTEVAALASPAAVADPHGHGLEWPARPRLDAHDMVVICGVGEIGPWGTSSTRAQAELGGSLGADGVVELAMQCGLLEWQARGLAGEFVDMASGEAVAEHELVDRYRDEVEARCGIRAITDTGYVRDVEVFTDRPLTIGLASEADARAFAAASPGATVARDGDAFTVTLRSGSALRLNQRAELPRGVTAPIPEGMEPTALGLPVELASSIDRIAAWNVAVTAEAFRDAGTDPAELLGAVHPARVGSTQGSGMGGMDSIRSLYLDPVRGGSHANDLLQEALGNVPAAHAMQSVIGGYGPMVHPVAACATAAVSLEVALDLVRLGKADVVVSGGIDDLGPEGIIGFADMAATASSDEMTAAGFEPSEMSRPGDRSRAGFVESQGGGTFLVCRGRVAAELGLPVRAVVALARSHSDGIQTSIPAPGLGALAVGTGGGGGSPLASALADHGLGPDDISVVSKHDTSTRANDPNEAAIHERLQALLGRTPGNPLRVISQKSLTGHAKGGAAAWQVAGLCDVFARGVVPGNRNLDSVDPDVVSGPALVVDDRPLALDGPPRAALATSLGFGHVSAAVLLVHPEAFLAGLPERERAGYLDRATARRRRAAHLRKWARFGGEPAFRKAEGRRLAGADAAAKRDAEIAVLADPAARLGAGGRYVTGPAPVAAGETAAGAGGTVGTVAPQVPR